MIPFDETKVQQSMHWYTSRSRMRAFFGLGAQLVGVADNETIHIGSLVFPDITLQMSIVE
jgi:hypothetical protein